MGVASWGRLGVALCMGLYVGCGTEDSGGDRPGSGGLVTATGGLPGAGGGGVSGAGGVPVANGTGALAAGTGGAVRDGREFMPGTDPARNQVQPGQLCQRLAEIQCAGEAYCCDSPGRDQQACVTEMTAGCRQELYLDQIASAAEAGFDAALAAAAFQGFEDLAAQCDPDIARWASRDSGLRGIMRGTRTGSCAPGGLQRVDGAIAVASCALDADLACLPSYTSFECERRGGAGTACFSDFNCTPDAYCYNPDADLAGSTCKRRKGLGEPCTYFFECETLLCGAGGTCVDADVQAAYCLKKN